jgi:RimJ/RimL family protein N-acetyltransferase
MPIRAYTPSDTLAFIALLQRQDNDPITLEAFTQSEERHDSNTALWRVLLEEHGNIVGCAELSMRPSTPIGWRDLKIIVSQEAEGQGFGQRLLEEVLVQAQTQGLVGFEISVRDNDNPSRTWLEKRGFEFDFHRFESELNLLEFEPSAFANVVTRAKNHGIRFATRADFLDDSSLHALHALDNQLFLDTPDAPGRTPLSFERFQKLIAENSQVTPESVIIALSDGEFIGMTIMLREEKTFYTGMTGVTREHRGKGIALALKVLAIQYAIQSGAVKMTTHNHSKNAPMIAVNQKLGYKQRSGLWVLKRQLK